MFTRALSVFSASLCFPHEFSSEGPLDQERRRKRSRSSSLGPWKQGFFNIGIEKTLGFSLLLNGNDTYTHANTNTNFITKFNTDNNSENKNNDHSRKTHNNK
jgi:hypothetical protein